MSHLQAVEFLFPELHVLLSLPLVLRRQRDSQPLEYRQDAGISRPGIERQTLVDVRLLTDPDQDVPLLGGEVEWPVVD